MSTRTGTRTAPSPLSPATPRARRVETPVGGVPIATGRARDEVSLGRLMAAVSQLEGQLSAPTSWVDAASLDALQRRLAGLAQTPASAQPPTGAFAALEQRAADFQNEIALLRSASAADQSTLEALRSRMGQLEAALSAAHERQSEERARNGALERSCEALDHELNNARVEDARTQRRVQALRAQVDGLKHALGSMRTRERAAREELSQTVEAHERALADNDLLRAELGDTQSLLRSTHAEVVSLRERSAALEADLEEAHAENDIMERWMNRALARVAELEDTRATNEGEENVVAFPASGVAS